MATEKGKRRQVNSMVIGRARMISFARSRFPIFATSQKSTVPTTTVNRQEFSVQPGQYPQYQQPAPQQYAPPQYQQPAPQQAPQSPAAALPPLGFADPSGGVTNPTARHLDGRTIAIVPKRVDEAATWKGQARPTAYFDLYVLDGGPLLYGDSEDPAAPRPFTHTVDTPAYFPDCMSGNVLFANEVRSKLGPDGRPTAMAVGVVQRGTRGNKPWLLTRFEKDVNGNERPDGARRRDALQKLVNDHASGAWTPPLAQALAQAQAPQVAPVQYGQPQPFASTAGATPPPHGQFVPTQPQQQYAPATYAQPQQYAQPAPVSAVPAPPAGYPPAPGWENNPAWGQFTPEQQSQIWQQVTAAQQANPQSAPPMPGASAPATGQATPPGAVAAAQNGPGW